MTEYFPGGKTRRVNKKIEKKNFTQHSKIVELINYLQFMQFHVNYEDFGATLVKLLLANFTIHSDGSVFPPFYAVKMKYL